MLIYILVLVYVVIKGTKMWAGNLDNIMTNEVMTDFEKLGKVKMKGIMPYLLIQTVDEEVFDYINVELS